MKEHRLKTWPIYFERAGVEKLFEYRRNDRDFQTGDIVILEEFKPVKSDPDWGNKNLRSVEGTYTGNKKGFLIGYVMPVGPTEMEWCIFTLLPCPPQNTSAPTE